MSNDEWGDYANEQESKRAEIGDNSKSALTGLVTQLYEAEADVARLDDELKAAKKRVVNISEEQLPEMLQDMGLEEGTVEGGLSIAIEEKVHASPKKDNREKVYDWLEEHGHGGLVKRTGVFTVGRNEEKKFRRWLKSIKTYAGVFQRKVEPATLTKFVNDQLKAGTDIPMELFGAYTRRAAKVTDKRGDGAA